VSTREESITPRERPVAAAPPELLEPLLERFAASENAPERLGYVEALTRLGVHDPRIRAALEAMCAEDIGEKLFLFEQYGDPETAPFLQARMETLLAEMDPQRAADWTLLEKLGRAMDRLGAPLSPELAASIQAVLANPVRGERAAVAPVVRAGPKVGRNEPCPCGSGKKWKKCCGAG
jgi:hypothetical protein